MPVFSKHWYLPHRTEKVLVVHKAVVDVKFDFIIPQTSWLKVLYNQEAIIYAFLSLPAGFDGPSTARSTCPAMPSLLASNWLPMTPSLLNGPPTAWPMEPMAPSGLNCLPIAPAEEIIEGFY